jgi:tape measure domain-containing protein
MAGINYKVTLDDSGAKKKLSDIISQVNQLDSAINKVNSNSLSIGGSGGSSALNSLSLDRVYSRMKNVTSGLISMGYESLQVAANFEAVQNQLNYAVGSAEKGGKAFQQLTEYSNHYGLDILKTGEAYAKFAATTKDTNLEGEKTMKIFQGVSKATTALHLSAADANGVFYALSQMLSKGKLSSEELNRQLGNRLPGALKLAAASMKMTTKELTEGMKKGTIDVQKFVDSFGSYLNTEFSGAAETASNSVQANMQKMKNSFIELKEVAGESLIPVFNMITGGLSGNGSVGGGLIGWIKNNKATFAGLAVGVTAVTGLLTVLSGLSSAVLSISAVFGSTLIPVLGSFAIALGVVVAEMMRHKIAMQLNSSKLEQAHKSALELEVDTVLNKRNAQNKAITTPERELALLGGLEANYLSQLADINNGFLIGPHKQKELLRVNNELEDIRYQMNYVRTKMNMGGNTNVSGLNTPGKEERVRENVTINIHNLVEGLTISTTNLKESADDVKRIVGELFQQAVFSAKVAGNVY